MTSKSRDVPNSTILEKKNKRRNSLCCQEFDIELSNN